MRITRLAGSTMLLALAAASAMAAPVTFGYTGGFTSYVVPATGLYDILAFGAQGGTSGNDAGGLGAKIGGDFTLIAGQALTIAVGGAGNSSGSQYGGGGGGSARVRISTRAVRALL